MTKTKTVSVKLDSRLYTALKTRADLNKSNVSDEIRSLLRSALAAEELDLYGNEVAGFIRGVVDARMDVAALDIERKLDATEDRILLGTIPAGKSMTLTVKLTAPLELDNRYADRVGETDWIFHGESAGETPYTGDTENIGLWMLLLCCAGAGTLTLTSQLRKKKN